MANEVDERTAEVRCSLRNALCKRFFERYHPHKALRDNRDFYQHPPRDFRSQSTAEICNFWVWNLIEI